MTLARHEPRLVNPCRVTATFLLSGVQPGLFGGSSTIPVVTFVRGCEVAPIILVVTIPVVTESSEAPHEWICVIIIHNLINTGVSVCKEATRVAPLMSRLESRIYSI